MKRFSAVLLLLFTVFFGLWAANPDFAYPKATLANAEKNYESAIQSPETSGIKLIKSLLEISGATAAIDPDSLPTVLPRIDRAIDACADDVTKALAVTIKAEIVYNIYNANRWKYDRNKTPDEPLPADITEWNGRQFRSQITATLNSAFDLAAAAPSARLTDYSAIITADRQTLYFLPTVCDFVTSKAVNLFDNINKSEAVESIIDRIIATSRYESAPWFWWSVKKIQNKNQSLNSRAILYDNLYLDHKNCEEAGYVLIQVADFENSIRKAPEWRLQALKDFIAQYPDYILINNLKNQLSELTYPRVSVSLKDIVAPLTEFDVTIEYDFVNNYGFTIYSISKDTYEKRGSSVISQVKTVSFKTDASKYKCDTTISVSLPAAGYYKIVPTSNFKSDDISKLFIMCTPFMPMKLLSNEKTAFTIVDYCTGAPMPGVKVTEISKGGSRALPTSGQDGIVFFDTRTNNNRKGDIEYQFTYNGQTFKPFNRGYDPYWILQDNINATLKANIFTNQELYHPGDTLKWAAVLYQTTENGKTELMPHEKAQILFYDTNFTEVGNKTSTSDDYGRIHGEFVIPKDGLTGNFILQILTPTENRSKQSKKFATKFITVSDFKLPTFKLDSLTVERDRPIKGEVTLGGNAVTYSGMPVAGGKVEITVFSAQRWYTLSPMDEIGTICTETESNGHFSVVIPDTILSKYQEGCYFARMAVTSLSGETQHASKSFTTGKPYSIIYNNSNSNNNISINTDNPFTLPAILFNADGQSVNDIEMRWWVNNSNEEECNLNSAMLSGIITTGKNDTIDFSALKSGLYNISIAPIDTSLADAHIKLATLSLYSIKHNTMPSSKKIFVPQTRYMTDDNGETEILLGIPDEPRYIYSVLGASQNIVSINVDKYSTGFHHIKVKLPENTREGLVKIYTTVMGENTMVEVNINRPAQRKLTLEGLSLRDRLAPGAPERWTLKLTDIEHKPIAGAMIATMFVSALNALDEYSMPSRFNIFEKPIGIESRGVWIGPYYARMLGKIKRLETLNIGQPEFKPSINSGFVRNYMMKSRAYGSASGTVGGILVTEDAEYLAQNEVMLCAPEEVACEQEITCDEAALDKGEVDGREPEFEYRPSEILQAFWMPELTFDQNGEAFINFTVPNANTTWSFNAFAWAKDLRATTMIREFTASKRVMVQPNLPRFLRAGDKAKVLATVFNNSEERAAVTTVVELFDFSTGKVYATAQSTDTIAPAASAIASIEVEADGDASVIGYRVRSTLGKFTDGEQAYIPVEAATSDVIESEVFYLNPGDADYTMTLPKGKNMQSTLDYTDNPAWNIIKQLPGLAKSDATTSTGATRQLFGAATAAGMLKAYPAIGEVLKMWIDNPDSQALTSRLSQNDELKAAILSETPWVQATASDSHRMARLSLLFDKKATSGSIDAAIATLRKLQRADGGWSWGGWSEQASLWATNVVLQDLGRLNVAGYLPSGKGLEKMIADGIAYYESKLDKNTKTDYALTYIVSMFPGHKLGLRGTQVVNATIQEIVGGWKSSSTLGKAVNALILNASGYKNVAKEIIGSLRQFAVASPSRGTSFPSINNVNMYADLLCAFASIEPDAPEIDGMRQWLVIHEQATTDLGSVDPTRLIAAFTASGSQWLAKSDARTAITAGGTTISTDEAEAATGHIVSAVPSDAAGKQLAIARGNVATPAYGSVISRFKAKSTDVKASSCDDLSVEKRIMALRNGKWQYVDEVIVGEQVRVLLTIKAKRTLEYVTVIDGRPASFEPVDQLPGWVWSGGAGFYRENRDSETRLFINYLPKGTYQITIDMTASLEGTFTSGIAKVQSQLAPSITAHSAGTTLRCQAK